MTDFSPEQLKKVAEWMGYGDYLVYSESGEVCTLSDGLWLRYPNKFEADVYNPEHNDAQAFELLRKLMELGEMGRLDFRYIMSKIYSEFGKGQTLNQAILNAVWEVINDSER